MKKNDFTKFGRVSDTKKTNRYKNAVIYTRVSSARQENNFSLQTQLDKCILCAKINNLSIVKEFGGVSESAKSDDRAEFQEMLKFVKNSQNQIGYIIVSDIDRFSRTGMRAIALVDELKIDYGIKVLESSTTSTSDNVSVDVINNLKMVLAEMENQTRKNKCVDGSRKRLESGYWCGKPPRGYIKVDKYTLKFSDEAEFIKKAFEMKSNGYSNTEILKVIRALGSKITKSRLTKYLSDPFYCGIIRNKHLDGDVVEGKHEPLISKELFLKINKDKPKIKTYKTSKMDENRPLQGDLKCSCGGVYTGYKKKGKYNYYKCNKCRHNTSVSNIHNSFEDLLSKYSFDKRYISLFKKQLKNTFKYIEQENSKKQAGLLSKISKSKKELDTVNYRFATAKINREIHEQVSSKIKADIDILEKELSNITFSLSNYDDYINKSLDLVNNFKGIWEEGDVKTKKDIQNILFSNQIEYNPKKMSYRTPEENLVMSMLTGSKDKIKARKRGQKPANSRFVHEVHQLSNLFLKDLEKLREFTDSYKNQKLQVV